MDLKVPDFPDSKHPIFFDSRGPMIIFSDFRDPIFNSRDPNRVPKTPEKTLRVAFESIRTVLVSMVFTKLVTLCCLLKRNFKMKFNIHQNTKKRVSNSFENVCHSNMLFSSSKRKLGIC